MLWRLIILTRVIKGNGDTYALDDSLQEPVFDV